MKYFSYDPEGDGFTLHNTAEQAKKASEDDISCYRDMAQEGWSDSIEMVCWGEIKQVASKVREMNKEEAEHVGIYFDNSFDTICDFELQDVPSSINEADALADALSALLDAVTNRSANDSINNQIIAAAKALGDYRGEK